MQLRLHPILQSPARCCVPCRYLNAVMRSMLEAARTMVVWCLDLLAFYALPRWKRGDGNPGEQWTRWSWLELGGFVLLAYGTFAYKGMVAIPGLAPLQLDGDEDEEPGGGGELKDPLLLDY